MNRRGFLKLLGVAPFAPAVLEALPPIPSGHVLTATEVALREEARTRDVLIYPMILEVAGSPDVYHFSWHSADPSFDVRVPKIRYSAEDTRLGVADPL